MKPSNHSSRTSTPTHYLPIIVLVVSNIEAIQSQLKNIYTNTLSTLCPLPWLEKAEDVQYNFDDVYIPLRTIDIDIQQKEGGQPGTLDKRDNKGKTDDPSRSSSSRDDQGQTDDLPEQFDLRHKKRKSSIQSEPLDLRRKKGKTDDPSGPSSSRQDRGQADDYSLRYKCNDCMLLTKTKLYSDNIICI